MNADQVNLSSDSVTPENLSQTVALTGYVYLQDFGASLGMKPSYVLFGSDNMGDRHYTLVGSVDIAYELPAGFNPTAAKLAAIEQERERVRRAFYARLAELDEQASKLQALEMTVEA